MPQKRGVMVAIALCMAAVAVFLGRSALTVKADDPKSEKAPDFKKLVEDSKLPAEVKANVAKTVYGKVYSTWPMRDGTFYFAVVTPDGRAHGFLFKTGDLKADAMVKDLLMAQEKQLRVGAYEDPTGMTGGVVVFNP